MKKYYRIVRVSSVAILFVGLGACSKSVAEENVATLAGVWAAGDEVAACSDSTVTTYLSDGVYLAFEKLDGEIHAVGKWRLDGDQIYTTHYHLPLPADGVVKAESANKIVKLTDRKFEKLNNDGELKSFVRCPDIALPTGHAH